MITAAKEREEIDRNIPKPWEDWCEGLCTARFASGGSITVFLDSYWEVY